MEEIRQAGNINFCVQKIKNMFNNAIGVKIIWFYFVCICFLTACSSDSSKNSAAAEQMEINCSPKSDTISFVKSKIEKLLSTAQEYSEITKKKEIDCIKSLCPNIEILIIAFFNLTN